jgi:hypothetical protein
MPIETFKTYRLPIQLIKLYNYLMANNRGIQKEDSKLLSKPIAKNEMEP